MSVEAGSIWYDREEGVLVKVRSYSEEDDKKVKVKYLDNRFYDYGEFYLSVFNSEFLHVVDAKANLGSTAQLAKLRRMSA